jgi:endoglucanase
VILNPSYSVFPAFSQLSDTRHGAALRAWKASGLALCEGARFGKFRLVPDWVVLDGPLFSLPTEPNLPGVFGYNAIRVPLHLAWDNPNSPLLGDYVAFWKSFAQGETVPAVVKLPGGEPGTEPALPGMLAIARFVQARAAREPFSPHDVEPIEAKEAYYSAALKMLVILAATDVQKAATSTPAR